MDLGGPGGLTGGDLTPWVLVCGWPSGIRLLVSSGEIRASLISFNASSQVATGFAASAALASSQLLLFLSPCPLPRVSLGTSSLSPSPSPSAVWQLSLPCCHCRRRSARRRGGGGVLSREEERATCDFLPVVACGSEPQRALHSQRQIIATQ